ncbi:MAG TPA: peroxiredoxin [Planctomycetaceae bacterium]|nr:peroxiredoxin [Planctomycetaceae bacterium]
MRNYPETILALLCFAVVSIFSIASNAAEPRERHIGRRVTDFTLTDATNESPWKLTDQDAKVIVLYFNSTECPVTNRYLPTLNRLKATMADKGVVIVAINSNQHDSLEDVRQHAREYEIEFPVLSDPLGRVARSLAATRTAEAFVLDRDFKVRYRGVIDDRYERGVTRPKATRDYLADAVSSVLKGRAVKIPVTDVEACPINLAAEKDSIQPQRTVTFSEHIAPIIQRRCQACHRPGGIGPFDLITFDDASAWSDSIREVVTSGLMPPWHADAPHGHFLNDRSLTEEEYATLLDWIDDGREQGDPEKLPAPREFSESWSIGKPDLVAEMDKSIEVPAETPQLGVPYKYVWAGEPFESEVWVTAAEVQPGATDVVHHASVYIVPDGVDIKLVNDARPTGTLNDLFSPIDSLPHLVSYVPGDNAFVHRGGHARRIPKGARLLFEMHYTPVGKRATDRTKVGLKFAKQPPKHEVLSTAAINYWFSIPPGAADHLVHAKTERFTRDTVLLAMNPHMHYRGKAFRYELVEKSGERSVLLNVPSYNFEWQSTYWLKEPVLLPKGSRIECTATFDNSEDNPFNPDPTVRVTWGEQTWQEMMLGSIEIYEK